MSDHVDRQSAWLQYASNHLGVSGQRQSFDAGWDAHETQVDDEKPESDYLPPFVGERRYIYRHAQLTPAEFAVVEAMRRWGDAVEASRGSGIPPAFEDYLEPSFLAFLDERSKAAVG